MRNKLEAITIDGQLIYPTKSYLGFRFSNGQTVQAELDRGDSDKMVVHQCFALGHLITQVEKPELSEAKPPPERSMWYYDNDPARRYEVLFTTNTSNRNKKHPPQVVYRNPNNKTLWSVDLDEFYLKFTHLSDEYNRWQT